MNFPIVTYFTAMPCKYIVFINLEFKQFPNHSMILLIFEVLQMFNVEC